MRCTYLGDKIIVLTFALRAAAALGRVLYIDWPPPCGLETYFAPACIDWRLPASTAAACRSARVQKWFMSPEAGNMNNHTAHERLTTQLLETSLAPSRAPGCLRFYGNYRWPSTFSTQQYAVSAGTPADVFHFLLRPTALLSGAILDAKRALFGAANERAAYTAMHVRMGDGASGTAMPTEKWFKGDRRLSHADAMHMVACALVATPQRVLVATDNSLLREALVRHNASALGLRGSDVDGWAADALGRGTAERPGLGQALPRAFAWAGPPGSEERAFGATNDTVFKRDLRSLGEFRLRTALTELGLMAGATCLVPSPKTDYAYFRISPALLMSGFSEIAMVWGRLPVCVPHADLNRSCWWRTAPALQRPRVGVATSAVPAAPVAAGAAAMAGARRDARHHASSTEQLSQQIQLTREALTAQTQALVDHAREQDKRALAMAEQLHRMRLESARLEREKARLRQLAFGAATTAASSGTGRGEAEPPVAGWPRGKAKAKPGQAQGHVRGQAQP